MSPRKPTFIIGGAPRSGTTFLAEALGRHPEVFMARPFIPEPKVFMGARQDLGAYDDRYAQLFADAPPEARCGEKTSYYLESRQACELIQQVAPDVRLVFIVREPVARAYSNYLWSRKNGLETLSFEEAIAREGRRSSPLPPEKAYARPFDYLARGRYASLAEPFFTAFPPTQIRFFLYEDLSRRGEALFAELQEFLSISPLALSSLNVGIVNSARETGPPIDSRLEQQLRERMQADVRRFARLSGLDIEPWEYN